MVQRVLSTALALALLGACAPVDGLADDDAGGVDGAAPPVIIDDGGTADATPIPATLHGVKGNVSGLDGASVTLRLNGTVTLDVPDGPFAFPPSLLDAATWKVVVAKSPATRTCTVEHGTGTVTGGDADGVLVRCLSTDATLSALSLSPGPLSPAFDPKVLEYVARSPVPMFTTDLTATLTATPSSPVAKLTFAGAAMIAGTPTAPFALPLGTNRFEVGVTAPDGVTAGVYGVSVSKYFEYTFLKSPDTQPSGYFGQTLAAGGDTIAVGAPSEAGGTGRVHVYRRSPLGVWSFEATLTAAHPHVHALFGSSVALSGDSLVVGAISEDFGAPGVDGDPETNAQPDAGAAYVFVRSGTTWMQQAFLRAPHPTAQLAFGGAVAISGDTMVVGALLESSGAIGVDGDDTDQSTNQAGAAFVYVRAGTTWSKQAYLKASNTSKVAQFGCGVAVSGNTVAVGATGESSASHGVNGSQTTDVLPYSGAVYVFTRSGTMWSQQAYVKAGNTSAASYFGESVALDGDTLAVSQPGDASSASLVDGDEAAPPNLPYSGAVFVYARSGTAWSQQAYVKSSYSEDNAYFGASIALRGDMLAVGSPSTKSRATIFGGEVSDLSRFDAGTAYLYRRTGTVWAKQPGLIKASNTRDKQFFGTSVSVGESFMVVGAPGDGSKATLIGGDESDNSAGYSGAAWAFPF